MNSENEFLDAVERDLHAELAAAAAGEKSTRDAEDRAVSRLAEVLALQENAIFEEYEGSDSVAIYRSDGVVSWRDVFLRNGGNFVCVAGDFLPAEQQPGFQRFEKFMRDKERNHPVFWQPVPTATQQAAQQAAVPKKSIKEALKAAQQEWSKEKS